MNVESEINFLTCKVSQLDKNVGGIEGTLGNQTAIIYYCLGDCYFNPISIRKFIEYIETRNKTDKNMN